MRRLIWLVYALLLIAGALIGWSISGWEPPPEPAQPSLSPVVLDLYVQEPGGEPRYVMSAALSTIPGEVLAAGAAPEYPPFERVTWIVCDPADPGSANPCGSEGMAPDRWGAVPAVEETP